MQDTANFPGNPLGILMAERHDAQLDAVHAVVSRFGCVLAPVATDFDDDGKPVPASNARCRTASVHLAGDSFEFEVTGDIPSQVAEGLRKIARKYRRAARQMEISVSAGTFPAPN